MTTETKKRNTSPTTLRIRAMARVERARDDIEAEDLAWASAIAKHNEKKKALQEALAEAQKALAEFQPKPEAAKP